VQERAALNHCSKIALMHPKWYVKIQNKLKNTLEVSPNVFRLDSLCTTLEDDLGDTSD
jgi:hypothetical protein